MLILIFICCHEDNRRDYEISNYPSNKRYLKIHGWYKIFAGCTVPNNRDNEKNKPVVSNEEEAKQTVIRYLKAVNDNDYDEQLRYLSTKRRSEFEQNWKNSAIPVLKGSIGSFTPQNRLKPWL